MVEYASPLADVMTPGYHGAAINNRDARITLAEAPIRGALQLAGWQDFEVTARPVLSELGFDGPGEYGLSKRAGALRLFRVAPDRVLILSDEALPRVAPHPGQLALLDLSHSRTAIVVSGDVAQDVLARLAGIDFRLAAFPVDGFVQTGIHHIGVLILRPSPGFFSIVTPVTWSRSLWEIVCLAAKPFGYVVGLSGNQEATAALGCDEP